MKMWARIVVVGALSIVAASCSDSRSPTAPVGGAISPEVRAALDRSIQDEYLAETIYQGVISDHGPVLPFLNVLTAEQRHSASLAQLFVRYGLMAPASQWTLNGVPHFSVLTAACGAAATAERENIAMYDELLRLELPADVRQVFGNNRAASLVNHLPAFERCS